MHNPSLSEQFHGDFCCFVQTALNICLRTRINALKTPKGKYLLISLEGDQFSLGFLANTNGELKISACHN